MYSMLWSPAIWALNLVMKSSVQSVSITNQYLADDIVTRPLRVVEGHAEVPGGIGLGVDVDESKVRKYQRAL